MKQPRSHLVMVAVICLSILSLIGCAAKTKTIYLAKPIEKIPVPKLSELPESKPSLTLRPGKHVIWVGKPAGYYFRSKKWAQVLYKINSLEHDIKGLKNQIDIHNRMADEWNEKYKAIIHDPK